MANRKQRRTRRRSQRQSGGSPSVAYIGDTIMATGGAPLEVRTAQDPHCAGPDSLRPAPMTGGRSRRNQRGGGCGCMGAPLQQRGGGSGNGGYSVMLGQNENIGYPLAYVKAPCPTQMGGDPKQLINSYQTGYGLINPVNTSSSNYMDYQSYGRQCMGGGKRRRRSKSRSRRSRR